MATGLKSIAEARVGDTLTTARHPAPEPLPGYRPALPLVFAGIYPLRGDEYPLLRDALDKLHLNDASFVWEPESSVALGHGFPVRVPRPAPHGDRPGAARARVRPRPHRLGALGRVPRPAPGGAEVVVDNPAHMPPPGEIEDIAEPWVGLRSSPPPSTSAR